MNIIIIDGVESERLRLESLLAGQHGYKVVLSTKDAEEALIYMSRNSYDLVVIDPDFLGLLGAPTDKAEEIPKPHSHKKKSAGEIQRQSSHAYTNEKANALSNREYEILVLLHQGYTKKSI